MFFNLSLGILAISLLIKVKALDTFSTQPVECPGYSVPDLRNEADRYEISFIFYGVEWSNESRLARLIYNEITNYYTDFYFAAVNCYHMQCNCSRTHETIVGSGSPHIWPTLVINYGRYITLQYNGQWQFEYLVRFMNNLIQPLNRIQNAEELKALILESDAVVLALCTSAHSTAYKRYIAAAVKWLESDPERNVRFAVIFGQNSLKQLKLETNASLPLLIMLDSRSKVQTYNSNGVWMPQDIINWVQTHLKKMRQYLHGYSTPESLVYKAQQNAVLAISVNSNPLGEDFYSIMTHKLGKYRNLHFLKLQQCEQYWWREHITQQQQIMFDDLQHGFDLETEFGLTQVMKLNECQRLFTLNRHTLTNYYRLNGILNYLWSYLVHNSDADDIDNPYAPRNILLQMQRTHCLTPPHYITPGLQISVAKFITRLNQKLWQHADTKLRPNHTLSVSILDDAQHGNFVRERGIPQNSDTAATAFIVDSITEAVYVMPQPFNYATLLQFLHNYYARNLSEFKRANHNVLIKPQPNLPDTNLFNYNTPMLQRALEKQNVTNVVLLHTPACALCAVLSQTFVQIAFLLRHTDIHFIRLDTSKNDLPWELIMPNAPALLVFPKGRATESRIFPQHLKADVKHVFEFIVSQLEPVAQLRAVLASCKQTIHVKSCLEFARNLAMQHIGQHLKYWEIYVAERNIILEKLTNFNDIYMEIQRSFS